MKFGEAVIISKNINSEKYTLEEKINAIETAMKAPTINVIFKDDLCEIIRFLLSICTEPADAEQTNEDWFIMLSTEEKARFIAMFSLRRKCVNEGEFYESVKNSLINASELPEMPMILRKDIEEWLKDKREINVEGGKKHE